MEKKKNVLITGASGFVGTNLRSYLKESMLSEHLVSRSGLEQINSNMINELDGFAIVHLAGLAHDVSNINTGDKYFSVNTDLTKKAYDAFLLSDARIFIFISSVKAVADNCKVALTEETIPNPSTFYGKSKLLAEEYILNIPCPENKLFFILRPCMIYGHGNKGNLNLLYQVVKKGIPYPLAAFKNQRSFLSVENLCFVIHELIQRTDIPSGIYHVCDDDPVSTNELVKIIASSLGRKERLINVPPILVRMIAVLGDRILLPLNSERLRKLTDDYIVSNYKLKSALQRPLPVCVKDGLKRTIESFNQGN